MIFNNILRALRIKVLYVECRYEFDSEKGNKKKIDKSMSSSSCDTMARVWDIVYKSIDIIKTNKQNKIFNKQMQHWTNKQVKLKI